MRIPLFAVLLLGAAPAAADTLIVGNKGENSVSFIDLESGEEVAKRETGPMPHEVAISPDGARAAVVEYGGNGVLLFDVRSTARLERIDLGRNRRPHGLLWLADNRLLITTEGSDTLVTVLTGARGSPDRVRDEPTGGEGSHMVVAHHGSRAFVANMRSSTVSDLDLDGQRDVVAIETGGVPEGMALSADGRRLWVADRDGASVSVFDTASRTRLRRIETGATPIRVVLSPDGAQAVVSNFGVGTLTAIDTTSFKPRTIPVSGEAAAQQVTILFSASGSRLYVAETGRNAVAELDWPSGRVLRRIAVGKNGDGLAISPVDARPR